MDAAQRKSADIAMQLIRETGTCAINEEDFAAVYEENERLRDQNDGLRNCLAYAAAALSQLEFSEDEAKDEALTQRLIDSLTDAAGR